MLSGHPDVLQQVSVPLRGYGFEMLPSRLEEGERLRVSVPLRGYGFEIFNTTIASEDDVKFPSPCGDMVLK